MKLIAIHQPNFFPWLGYFDKIARSDLFIFLDSVQFPKKGGTWINRVQILINGKAAWVTVPVVRNYHGVRLIKDMKINNNTPWSRKVLKTIEYNYASAPFFQEVFPKICRLLNKPVNSISEYNIATIILLSKMLGFDTSKFVIGSTLDIEGKSTDLLISIVNALNGSAYLCGQGAKGYQDDSRFKVSGIDLIHQLFSHPTYPQAGTAKFIAGLSIIDVLMNCGFKNTRDLFESKKIPEAI